MVRITPIRLGWDPEPGDDFYPDDLPEDWRLAYFSNEFPAVLVPFPRWRDADRARLAQWAMDVPPDFRFYLEAESGRPDARDWARLSETLGARLGGLVAGSGEAAASLWSDFCYARLASDQAGPPPGWERSVWEAPGRLYVDLRAARVWLDEIAARVGDGDVLILMGSVEHETLRRWWMMTRMMGVAP
ncbi:hypothetical protein [Thiocystis violacea]|uniref:hypothetical protein n=1 Tax=Thiocystis violacea TaxID=13725 RepID=UPI001904B27C|nr:hypothetical protein [Thiocystis violacea]MBK1716067.1 hypothetical protein [Thiocystis violacea]